MFNHLRSLPIIATLGAALSHSAALFRSVSTLIPAPRVSATTGGARSHARHHTVAHAKRSAVKRRNQLRHKRLARG